MGREDKNFNIPRGDDEYNAIRQNLRARIHNYEESLPKQEVSQQVPQNNMQNPYQAHQQMQQPAYSQPQQQAQFSRPAQPTYSQPVQPMNSQTQAFRPAQPAQRPQAYQQQQPQQQFQQSQQMPQQPQQVQQQMPQQPQNANVRNPYAAQNLNGQPAQAPVRPQNNMSYQQYQQNIGRAQQPQNNYSYNQNAGFSQASQSSYSHQTYSSPFAQQTNQDVTFRGAPQQPAMASASHSREPVMYKPKKRQSAAKTVGILIAMVALVFGLSWALREFVFQAYEIPSGSMEKTIMTGDMAFAEKITYKFRAPQAGEIVTFDDPINSGRILIKRVIATEGQKIDIKNNKLYIDGEEQDEDYVNDLPTSQLRSANVSYPYTVPDGEI